MTGIQCLETKKRIASVLFDLGHSQVTFIPEESDNPKWVEFRDQTRGKRAEVKTIRYEEMAELVRGTNINSMKKLIDGTIRRVLDDDVPLSDLDKWSNDLSVVLPRIAAHKENISRL